METEEEEEIMSDLAVTYLLQHTLRSWCIHDNSQWVYAVFWRILPRNYPPPKWDTQGGAYDRSRGNRRNWILAWEDGFCNFAASTAIEMEGGDQRSVYGTNEFQTPQQQEQRYQPKGLQPELFFKMSHEIYNYGEGLIGKVAADHSHKWIYKEPNAPEMNLLSAWNSTPDTQPRTWEAQFQSGIKTIALIAVREGVIQLGSVHKVVEDLSHVVLLRKKFSYIETIPGALLPHPSSSSFPFNHPSDTSPWQHFQPPPLPPPIPQPELRHHFNHPPPAPPPMGITPSMSSLEALLSKLPNVVPPNVTSYCQAPPHYVTTTSSHRSVENTGAMKVDGEDNKDGGESSGSMKSYRQNHQLLSSYHNHHLNVTSNSNNRY